MRLEIILGTLLISSVHFSNAFAGTGSSGGGMVVACSKGSETTYELLDLYEAKKNPKIQIVDSTGDINSDYRILYRNLFSLRKGNQVFDARNPEVDPSKIDAYIDSNLVGISKLINWHNDKTSLPSTHDQGVNANFSANCKLEQLAIFYDDSRRMTVDQKIWEKLDTLSQAALLMHEEFYFNQRQIGDKNSENSRLYVAEVLSKNGAIPAYSNAKSFQFFCNARNDSLPRIGQTDFFLNISQNNKGGKDLELQFTYLLGREMLVKSSAKMSNVQLEVTDSFYGLVTDESSSAVTVKSNLETLHGKGFQITLMTTPGKSTSLSISKDGKLLGIVDTRMCTQIH